jgi:ATP-binding cassette subfamily C protein CydD
MSPLGRRLLRCARAARWALLLTAACSLAATGLILLQAGLLARILATAAAGTTVAALGWALGGLLAVVAFRAVTSYGSEAAALRAAITVKSRLRRQLTEHAIRLGPGRLAGQQAGQLTTLATRGLDALDAWFSRYLPQLLLAALVPAAVLIRVGLADWISAVVIAATLPLLPVFGILVGLHTRASTERQWQLLARLGGHFLDVVEGLPTLKVFGRGQAQEQVIAQVTGAHRRATMKSLRIAFLSGFVLEIAAALATGLVAVEVGLRMLAGHLDYQTGLLVLLLTPEAFLPLRAVGAQFHASAEGTAAARQAFEILDAPGPAAPPAPGGPPGRVPARPARQHAPDLRQDPIRLNGVALRYPGREEPALDEVSLTIGPGERITLTGPSGAGKSSLLALLLRLAEPTQGWIEAGGTPLAAIPVDQWRAQIGWVPQHPYLFAGSVAENIALGHPAAGRAAVARAALAAGAAGFIDALPDGYDTQLGERGLRLSSGQRQQLALARAFLRDAPLLLLDEPAAHLDAASAHDLAATLGAGPGDRTIIQVAHGRPPADGPGRVLRLEAGRLRPAVTGLPALGAGPARHRAAALAVTP